MRFFFEPVERLGQPVLDKLCAANNASLPGPFQPFRWPVFPVFRTQLMGAELLKKKKGKPPVPSAICGVRDCRANDLLPYGVSSGRRMSRRKRLFFLVCGPKSAQYGDLRGRRRRLSDKPPQKPRTFHPRKTAGSKSVVSFDGGGDRSAPRLGEDVRQQFARCAPRVPDFCVLLAPNNPVPANSDHRVLGAISAKNVTMRETVGNVHPSDLMRLTTDAQPVTPGQLMVSPSSRFQSSGAPSSRPNATLVAGGAICLGTQDKKRGPSER